MRILVIEDNSDVIDTLTLIFQHRWPKVEVVACFSGKDGMEQFHLKNTDAIFLDLGLPDIDGTNVLTDIRRESKVPVVIVTARTDDDVRVQMMELGATKFIPKPFKARDIINAISDDMDACKTPV